jgi:hypothetical protein
MELGGRLDRIVPEGYSGTGEELAEILQRIGFEAGTCQKIAAMPFPEAFNTAQRCLEEFDFDADEILAPFTEEPDEI